MPPSPERPPSAVDRVALLVATGLGVGYAPFAPGTWGSLPGVALAWGVSRLGGSWAVAVAAAGIALFGTWAADRAARVLGEVDPSRVVVDEIAGQIVALLFLPPTPLVLGAGFVAFRILDVAKPWPANRLEELPGGSGIMADDLMAGLYANLFLQGLAAWRPELLGVS